MLGASWLSHASAGASLLFGLLPSRNPALFAQEDAPAAPPAALRAELRGMEGRGGQAQTQAAPSTLLARRRWWG